MIPTKSFYGRSKTDAAQYPRQHVNTRVLHADFDNSDVDETEDNSDTDSINLDINDDLNLNDNDFTFSESEYSVDGDSDVETGVDVNVPDAVDVNVPDAVDVNNHQYRWRKRNTLEIDTTYTGHAFPPPVDPILTPYQYFKQMFDDSIIADIVDNTNLYSVQQTGTSIALTTAEMEKFLGILVTMSIIKLPRQRMYWSSETRIPAVADVMSSRQFEKIKRYLHFVDNNTELPKTDPNYDKLFKVRSLIDAVVGNCRKIPQEEKHSIDEQILPTKGRSSLKQYLPNKPNKWGIKVWARCGVSGIVYDFEIYCGKNGSNVDEIPGLLMGGNVVYRLTRSLPLGVNHKVYFDNFFSSANIMLKLTEDKLWAIATIRKDRLKDAKPLLKNEKELKKEGRGSSDHVVDANSGICIVRWYDNNIVQLISNYAGYDLGTKARRWSKKDTEFIEIDRPKIVEDYNAHMGGVDLCDMLLETYRVRQRTIKYYFHIFYYCIGISIVNSWLLYRRHMEQRNVAKKNVLCLQKFQSQIADSLSRAGKLTNSQDKRSRGRPSCNSSTVSPPAKRRPPTVEAPTQDVRLDKCGHFPVFQEKQSRCRHCRKGYSFVQCCKCKMSLCLVKARNCFNDYHGVGE